jgi:hypothetical protein
MQTSNFARAGSHPNAVAISQGIPKWYAGRAYKALAPTWAMIGIKDNGKYTEEYFGKVLSKLSPQRVYEELGEDAILLCYEKPGVFCHRRLVAEWLEKNLGIKIPEMGFGEETHRPKKDDVIETSLF